MCYTSVLGSDSRGLDRTRNGLPHDGDSLRAFGRRAHCSHRCKGGPTCCLAPSVGSVTTHRRSSNTTPGKSATYGSPSRPTKVSHALAVFHQGRRIYELTAACDDARMRRRATQRMGKLVRCEKRCETRYSWGGGRGHGGRQLRWLPTQEVAQPCVLNCDATRATRWEGAAGAGNVNGGQRKGSKPVRPEGRGGTRYSSGGSRGPEF